MLHIILNMKYSREKRSIQVELFIVLYGAFQDKNEKHNEIV